MIEETPFDTVALLAGAAAVLSFLSVALLHVTQTALTRNAVVPPRRIVDLRFGLEIGFLTIIGVTAALANAPLGVLFAIGVVAAIGVMVVEVWVQRR
jgi:hypothetical protein